MDEARRGRLGEGLRFEPALPEPPKTSGNLVAAPERSPSPEPAGTVGRREPLPGVLSGSARPTVGILLQSSGRIVRRPDERLPFQDRQHENLGHAPVGGLEPGAEGAGMRTRMLNNGSGGLITVCPSCARNTANANIS